MYEMCILASQFFLSFATKNYDLEKGFTGLWQPSLNKFEQQLKPSYFQFTEIGCFTAFIPKKLKTLAKSKRFLRLKF